MRQGTTKALISKERLISTESILNSGTIGSFLDIMICSLFCLIYFILFDRLSLCSGLYCLKKQQHPLMICSIKFKKNRTPWWYNNFRTGNPDDTHTHTSLVHWTCLNFWGVNQLFMTGNDRFHVACGLQPSLLFVWRVLLCCQVPLPLWTDVSGLLGPHQAGRQASRRQQRKRVEEWWSDRGDELLAKHPGARPGPLPNREKTSRTHLCGDRDLSLHLKAKQHPIVICLNNHVHRTALKTIFFSPKCSLLHPTVQQWIITHSWF